MKKILYVALVALVASTVITGCKTSEKNYREAYERATAKNDRDVTDFDKTIYARYRNQTREQQLEVDGKAVPVKLVQVRVTNDGGGIPEWLKAYSVVVAEFKQLFNANSMRKRFAEAGYPRTFLVENAEPYYYVIVESTNDLAAAATLCDSLKASSPLPLKADFPYILSR